MFVYNSVAPACPPAAGKQRAGVSATNLANIHEPEKIPSEFYE